GPISVPQAWSRPKSSQDFNSSNTGWAGRHVRSALTCSATAMTDPACAVAPPHTGICYPQPALGFRAARNKAAHGLSTELSTGPPTRPGDYPFRNKDIIRIIGGGGVPPAFFDRGSARVAGWRWV